MNYLSILTGGYNVTIEDLSVFFLTMYSRDKLDYNVPAKYFTYIKVKKVNFCAAKICIRFTSRLEYSRHWE